MKHDNLGGKGNDKSFNKDKNLNIDKNNLNKDNRNNPQNPTYGQGQQQKQQNQQIPGQKNSQPGLGGGAGSWGNADKDKNKK